MHRTQRVETVGALVATALIVIGCVAVLRPFLSAILWAAVLCYSTWPAYVRLDRFLQPHRKLAAFLMTVLISAVLVAPFLVVALTLADHVGRMGDILSHLQQALPTEPPAWLTALPVIGPAIGAAWADYYRDAAQLSAHITSGFRVIGRWVLRHSLHLGKGIAQMIVSVLISFFFFRDGERLVAGVMAGGRRLLGDVTQHLLQVAGRTVRGVVYGIIGTALVQSLMAFIGFWAAGVPSPLVLSLLTFALAVIPLVGPPLVWVPATLWLFIEGRPAWGAFLGLWGLLGISGIDNLVRPYLMSLGTSLPFLATFLGAIGGVSVFGFIGIFLGPVLLATGYSLLREITHDETLRRRMRVPSPPDVPAPPETRGVSSCSRR